MGVSRRTTASTRGSVYKKSVYELNSPWRREVHQGSTGTGTGLQLLRTDRRMVPVVDRAKALQIRYGHYRSRAGKDKGN